MLAVPAAGWLLAEPRSDRDTQPSRRLHLIPAGHLLSVPSCLSAWLLLLRHTQVMDINPNDTVLTLTSGGCNALNLLVQGAGTVSRRRCVPACAERGRGGWVAWW